MAFERNFETNTTKKLNSKITCDSKSYDLVHYQAKIEKLRNAATQCEKLLPWMFEGFFYKCS